MNTNRCKDQVPFNRPNITLGSGRPSSMRVRYVSFLLRYVPSLRDNYQFFRAYKKKFTLPELSGRVFRLGGGLLEFLIGVRVAPGDVLNRRSALLVQTPCIDANAKRNPNTQPVPRVRGVGNCEPQT